MRIISIDLENVKSYKSAHIEFADGTNAISGHNGAGKSTILEAIGFVLFAYLQTTQQDLVRYGEKTATIEIVVENKGETYNIIRACGASSKYTVYQGDEQLTINKGDTIEWLYGFLGISRGEELPTIFKDAVGVPQGLLTTAFLETAANRKRVFAPLLHVDEYEKAWTNLRETERAVTDKLHTEELTIAGLTAAVADRDELENKQAHSVTLMIDLEVELQEKKRQEVTVAIEISGYEDLKAKLEKARQKLEMFKLQEQSATSNIEHAKVELAEAEKAAAVIAETEEAYKTHNSASEKVVELQAEKAILDSATADIRILESELKQTKGLIADTEEALSEAEEAEVKAAELKPYAVQLEKQSSLIAVMYSNQTKLYPLQKRYEDQKKSLERYEGILEEGVANLEKVETINAKLSENRICLTNLEVDITKISEAGIATKTEIETLEKRLELLSGDQSTCPVCGTELDDAHKVELVNDINAEMTELKTHDSINREKWKALSDEIKHVKSEINSLESELRNLPSQATVDTYRDTVNRMKAEVASLEQDIQKIESETQGIVAETAEEKLLKDLVAELRANEAIANRKAEIESRLIGFEKKIEETSLMLTALEEKILKYGNTNTMLETYQGALSASEQKYRLYIANVNQAGTVGDKRNAVKDLEMQISNLKIDLEAETKDVDFFSCEYSPEKHTAVIVARDELTKELAMVVSNQRVEKRTLEETEEKLKSIYEKATALDEHNATYMHLKTVQGTLGYLRQAIRDAGPEITKMIVAAVSISADRLFSEIMGDPSAHLVWTEDYDIIISDGDQERHFNQLSGGEQMSAALSVRMALLKEISSIDIAFFDEPTVNLDAQRRESLAEQILGVRGFTQLFVISHDDSFEYGTDNVVKVQKINGVSQVL